MSIVVARGAITTIDRTVSFTGSTPKGRAYSVAVMRERVTYNDADGSVLQRVPYADAVTRTQAQVTGTTVTLTDGTVLTADQVIEALARFFDAWSLEK